MMIAVVAMLKMANVRGILWRSCAIEKLRLYAAGPVVDVSRRDSFSFGSGASGL